MWPYEGEEGVWCVLQGTDDNVVTDQRTGIMDNNFLTSMILVVDRQEELSSISCYRISFFLLNMNINTQHFSGKVVHFYFPIFGTKLNSY